MPYISARRERVHPLSPSERSLPDIRNNVPVRSVQHHRPPASPARLLRRARRGRPGPDPRTHRRQSQPPNPRQGLAVRQRLSGILAGTGQHHHVTEAFTAKLRQMPWHVYEVRRVIRSRTDDPAKAANASRSLRTLAAGSRAQMYTTLRDLPLAEVRGAIVEDDEGIERAWLRWRGSTLPDTEHFLVAAPAGPRDKEGRGFQAAWEAATQDAGSPHALAATGEALLWLPSRRVVPRRPVPQVRHG